MRTNIDIDEQLLSKAIEASHVSTKKAAVDAALQLAVRLDQQKDVASLFGNVQWDGDLDEMRQSRFLDWPDELTDEKSVLPRWY